MRSDGRHSRTNFSLNHKEQSVLTFGSLLPSLLVSACLGTVLENYPRAELLVESATLADAEKARALRIIDIRSRAMYQAGHVPGAVWLEQVTFAKAFDSEKNAEAWGKRIGALGIDLDTPVVVYDDKVTPNVARVWWILRYWGLKDVRLLNGGWQAYAKAGLPKETKQATYPTRGPVLWAQAGVLADKDLVLKSITSKEFQILDTRSLAEYCGDEARAKRNGAIPGAKHLEWSELIDPSTQRFKSPTELARLFKDHGIDPAQPAIAHCQSGGRASVMAFALELMGNKNVRNYYKSWAEWGNDKDTPIIKPRK